MSRTGRCPPTITPTPHLRRLLVTLCRYLGPSRVSDSSFEPWYRHWCKGDQTDDCRSVTTLSQKTGSKVVPVCLLQFFLYNYTHSHTHGHSHTFMNIRIRVCSHVTHMCTLTDRTHILVHKYTRVLVHTCTYITHTYTHTRTHKPEWSDPRHQTLSPRSSSTTTVCSEHYCFLDKRRVIFV